MFSFGSKKKILSVEGMTCHHCEMTVEKALMEIPAVKKAKARHPLKSVEVEYIGDLDLSQVREKIEKAGYKYVGEL
ncbi:MAG: heavy-metal-associated domain-containing protein [Candidatus Kryptoniota bacterium]